MKTIDIKSLIIGVLLLGVVGWWVIEVLSITQRECQWCKESVKAGAKVCPHCLRDEPIPFDWPEPEEGWPTPAEEEDETDAE